MDPRHPKFAAFRPVLLGAGVFLAAFVLFWPAANYQFISLDDYKYVAQNESIREGLTPHGIRQAFSVFSDEYFLPVLFISYMLDVEMHGAEPRGFHLTNIILHALNSVLVFLMLSRITGALWKSALAAALFSLHPLRVEAVAWITARKDLLSSMWFLLAVICYVEFVRTRSRAWYAGTLVLFVLSLLTKPMLLAFPLLLLVLDFWPLGRLGIRLPPSGPSGPNGGAPRTWIWLLMEKAPFALVSLVFAVTTLWTQGTAIHPIGGLPGFLQGMGRAASSYFIYLGKMAWPFRLRVEGYLGTPGPGLAWSILAGTGLVLLSWRILRLSSKLPYLAAAWFWYLAALFPASGIILAGSQWLSDRFTYVPQMFFFIAAAWGLADLKPGRRRVRPMVWAGAALLACLSGWATRQQLPHWESGITLFKRTLEVDPGSVMGHMGLGISYGMDGDIERAEGHLRTAVDSGANLPENAYYSLGITLLKLGRPHEAIPCLERALDMDPSNHDSLGQLGLSKVKSGRLDDGISDLEQALAMDPGDRDLHFNLAFAMRKAGNAEKAIFHLEEAVRIDPRDHMALLNLGQLQFESGRLGDARSSFSAAVRLLPESAESWFARGRILEIDRDILGAVAAYTNGLAVAGSPGSRAGIESALDQLVHRTEGRKNASGR